MWKVLEGGEGHSYKSILRIVDLHKFTVTKWRPDV